MNKQLIESLLLALLDDINCSETADKEIQNDIY